MSTAPESQEEIRRLFQRHVPEVAEGTVEILKVARVIGLRSCVAVRSHAQHLDPVGACSGVRGVRLKAIAGELKGEHLTVIRWDESPQRFIQNAFGGHPPPEVALDESTHTAFVTVVDPTPHGPEPDLLGELVGWSIKLRGGKGQ